MANDIFVISDLHIGDGGPRDNFGYAGSDHPQQLMTFLDYVERENGELIILGDLFEFWQMNISKTIVNNMDLIERLGHMKAKYVVGNHDIDLLGFVGKKVLVPQLFDNLCTERNLTIGNKKFMLVHGHELDPYNTGDDPGKGRVLTILAGMAESTVGAPVLFGKYSVEVFLEGQGNKSWSKIKRCCHLLWFILKVKLGLISPTASNKLSPAENESHASQMLREYAEHRATFFKCDIAVVGHTHVPGHMDDWYFNTGSWVSNEKDHSYVRISPSGDVQVFDWNNGTPRPNETVLGLPIASKSIGATPDGDGGA